VALGGHREGALPPDGRERGRRGGLALRQQNAARHNAAVLAAIRELNPEGLSLAKVAAKLNARGIRTARGTEWDRKKVWRVLIHSQRGALQGQRQRADGAVGEQSINEFSS
jgi:hypothetical protein